MRLDTYHQSGVRVSGRGMELVKEGKDDHQAVGYLPDGTMIVVNQGQRHIGTTQSVVVAGAVQTSAGRLIFAELSH